MMSFEPSLSNDETMVSSVLPSIALSVTGTISISVVTSFVIPLKVTYAVTVVFPCLFVERIFPSTVAILSPVSSEPPVAKLTLTSRAATVLPSVRTAVAEISVFPPS